MCPDGAELCLHQGVLVEQVLRTHQVLREFLRSEHGLGGRERGLFTLQLLSLYTVLHTEKSHTNLDSLVPTVHIPAN